MEMITESKDAENSGSDVRLLGRAAGDLGDFLREAMLSQRFADVALCCPGGQKFLAHRLVLSAASPYLQEVLETHGSTWTGSCEPVTLILAEVEAAELAALLGLVYTGSATVPRSRLGALLRVAELLRIRLPELQPEAALPEDLSSCGPRDWRLMARRQVANQVTASPWNQTLRLYHSPKLQPILLQRSTPSYPGDTSSPAQPLAFETTAGATMDTHHCCLAQAAGELAEPSQSQRQAPASPEHRSSHEPVPACPQALAPANLPAFNAPPNSLEPKSEELSHPASQFCGSLSLTSRLESRSEVEARVDLQDNSTASGPTLSSLVSGNDGDDNNNTSSIDKNSEKSIGQPRERTDYKCQQCGKFFVTKASLKIHVRTHSGEKPFRCEECGKEFSQLRNYKYHRSVHEGTREFAASCPECGKCFNDRGYLSSHMKIHRNRKEYGCAECGASFNQRVAYNMHARIHSGLKPHACEECGKAFSRKMLLKQHLRTHSGERPYQCQVCHKAFADRSNMTLHTRLHSGLKPYQCTLCSKAFTKKHHLKTHLNYHTGSKPYSCPGCALSFSQSSNMRTHYKKCSLAATRDQTATVQPTAATAAGLARLQLITPPNSDQESSALAPCLG